MAAHSAGPWCRVLCTWPHLGGCEGGAHDGEKGAAEPCGIRTVSLGYFRGAGIRSGSGFDQGLLSRIQVRVADLGLGESWD